ncbi:MAG: hypothetical protein HY270_18545 [Deltaproteobacteria bacterium]|nr:hypothetical protein [Deltaproteobacteria bacterium]
MRDFIVKLIIVICALQRIVFAQAPAYLVKDINQAPDRNASSSPESLTRAGGRVFFVADDGIHGRELWVTDGTPQGSSLVKDINSGGVGCRCRALTPAGNSIYFIADDGVHGEEIWRSDGTEDGTKLVKEILPGTDSPFHISLHGANRDFHQLTVVGEELYFPAISADLKLSIWRTDGSDAGTAKIFESAFNFAGGSLAQLGRNRARDEVGQGSQSRGV